MKRSPTSQCNARDNETNSHKTYHFFSNPEIKSNFKISFYEDKLLLQFLKPKSELSGTYTCRGLLQNSESLSNQIQVSIYGNEHLVLTSLPII